MNVASDATLLEGIKRNDQKALELLYEKYYTALCNFSYTFAQSVEAAEEIVSDVFLNLWLKRKTLHIKSNCKSYLFVAVKNQSLNYLMSNKVKFEGLDNLDHAMHPNTDSTYSKILYQEFEKQIDNMLEALPPQRRAIFKLNRIDGLKYLEIAEVLSISVNTVQKQMTEAIKFLANYRQQHLATLTQLFLLLFL